MLVRLLFLALLLLVGPAASARPPAEWQFQDWNVATATAERNNKPLFVLFGFEECPYCAYLYKHGMDSSEVRSKYQANTVLTYYDTRAHRPDETVRLPGGATMSHAQFIQQFRAYPTPSWIFLSDKGTVLKADRGSKSSSGQLLSDLDAALAAR